MDQHWKRKLFLYFSHLGRFRRKKRDGHQQGEMKTPRVRKGWTPGERNRNTARERHTHTPGVARRGRGGRRGIFWMWLWAQNISQLKILCYVSVTQTHEQCCTCTEGFVLINLIVKPPVLISFSCSQANIDTLNSPHQLLSSHFHSFF